jgi:hypothetical protein
MKFLEDEPNRLLKRVQTIYKALKSGTVKMDDGRVFEYDLIKPTFSIVGRKKWEAIVHYYPHGFHLQYDRTPRTLGIEDVDNYVDRIHSRLNVKITTDYGKPIPRETIKKKIQEKFRHFGIFLSYGEVKFKKIYTSEPIDNINEEVSNEERRIIERLRTRAGLIYNALSEGHIMVKCYDGSYDTFTLTKMRYVLPETPRINFEDRFDDNDKIVSYGALMGTGIVKLYYKPNDSSCVVDDWFEAVAPIRKKFTSLGINIVFDGIDFIEEEPLNESVNEDEVSRLRKRVKVVFNALKTGTFELVNSKYLGDVKDVKCKYELTSHPIIRIDGVYAKREDGYDRLDANNNPILLRYKQTVQLYDVSVDCKMPEEPDSAHIFTHVIADHIKNKFKSFDINCYIRTIKFSDDNEMLNESLFKKPKAPDFGPEDEERLKKKINVVTKACTQFPITVVGHKVKVDISGYKSVIEPPKVIKYNDDEYDRPVYQQTEPELRIIVPQLYLETDSEEVYDLLNKVDEIDLNYEVYSELASRFRKFKVGFTSYVIYVRLVNKDNDLQEQFEYGDDDDDEYNYTDNGTPSQEKKIRAIYKALKEGYLKIRFDGELYKFKYVLPNKFGVKYSKVSRDMTLQIHKFSFHLYDSNNVLINPYNPINKQLHLAAYRLISKRFQINFGVIFEEPPVGYDNYQNINGDLQEEVVSELTDKERKKVKAIFTAFKKGVFDLEDDRLKIRYHLISDYWIKKSSKEGRLTIILKGNSFENVIIHKIHSDGTETLVKPNSNMWNSLFYYVKSKIEKIFKQYDIDIKLI